MTASGYRKWVPIPAMTKARKPDNLFNTMNEFVITGPERVVFQQQEVSYDDTKTRIGPA
jgi:hypothetical protein